MSVNKVRVFYTVKVASGFVMFADLLLIKLEKEFSGVGVLADNDCRGCEVVDLSSFREL